MEHVEDGSGTLTSLPLASLMKDSDKSKLDVTASVVNSRPPKMVTIAMNKASQYFKVTLTNSIPQFSSSLETLYLHSEMEDLPPNVNRF